MNRRFSQLRLLRHACLVVPAFYGASVAAHAHAPALSAESYPPASVIPLESDLVLARYLLSGEDFQGAKRCALNAYGSAPDETRRREAWQLLQEIDAMRALCLRILWHETRQAHADCDWGKMRKAVSRILQISPDDPEALKVEKWMKQRGIIRDFTPF